MFFTFIDLKAFLKLILVCVFLEKILKILKIDKKTIAIFICLW